MQVDIRSYCVNIDTFQFSDLGRRDNMHDGSESSKAATDARQETIRRLLRIDHIAGEMDFAFTTIDDESRHGSKALLTLALPSSIRRDLSPYGDGEIRQAIKDGLTSDGACACVLAFVRPRRFHNHGFVSIAMCAK